MLVVDVVMPVLRLLGWGACGRVGLELCAGLGLGGDGGLGAFLTARVLVD